MPAHVIRKAEKRDASELSRLFTVLEHPTAAEAIALKWTVWTNAGNAAFVAARPDGKLLGLATLHQMIVLHRPKPVGRITSIIVDPAARGCGIGRALVTAAEAALADAGCGMLEITSNFRLTSAHAFYEHLGYNRTSVRFAKDLLE